MCICACVMSVCMYACMSVCELIYFLHAFSSMNVTVTGRMSTFPDTVLVQKMYSSLHIS